MNIITILDNYVKENEIKKFIQIGVNDGVQSDWFREFILKNNWHGLMIEPHPLYIKEAIQSYSHINNLTWIESAVTNTPNVSKTLYYVDQRMVDNVAIQYKGVASFDKEHLIKHRVQLQDIKTIDVPCVSLSSLLDKYNFWDVDMIVMDVEGHEKSVIESCDWSKCNPSILIFETAHMAESDIRDIVNIANMEDYEYFKDRWDSILYKKT